MRIAVVAEVRTQGDLAFTVGHTLLRTAAGWEQFELRLHLIRNAHLLESQHRSAPDASLTGIDGTDGFRVEQQFLHGCRARNVRTGDALFYGQRQANPGDDSLGALIDVAGLKRIIERRKQERHVQSPTLSD